MTVYHKVKMLSIKYINVANQVSRAHEMEEMLRNKTMNRFPYSRFNATDKQDVIDGNFELTQFGAGAVGCYLSHMACIKTELEENSSLLILEDDVEISDKFFDIHDQLEKTNYDIIFLAVTFGQNIENYKRVISIANETKLIDLKNIGFAGTYGYFIPSQRKNNLFEKLKAGMINKNISAPLDLYYAALAHNHEIKAAVMLPYYLKLNKSSSFSSIGGDNHSQSILDIITNSLFIDLKFDEFIQECSLILKVDKRILIASGLIQSITPLLSQIKFR